MFLKIGNDNCFVKHYDNEENKVQIMSDQINYEELKYKEIVIKVTGLEAVQSGLWLMNVCLELLPLQMYKYRNQVLKLINEWKNT